MYWFQKLNNYLLQLCRWGVILSMGTIALIIPYEVFGRYILDRMSIWSGELSTYALAWATMLGGAVGLKKGYQVSMTFILEKLPPAVLRFVRGIGFLFMLFFLTMMVYYGVAQTILNHRQTSPGMEIPMSLPYAALPVGFFAMLLISIEEFLLFLGMRDHIGSSKKDGGHISESM